jgi:hypothetical protein
LIKFINHLNKYYKTNKSFTEKIGQKGIYNFFSINPKTKEKTHLATINNLITNLALDNWANALRGYHTYSNTIFYLAIGNDNSAVSASDTQLGNELYRVPVVSYNVSVTKQCVTDFFITDQGFVGQIEEVGIFTNDTATATANTGDMLSRVLWSHNKTNSEEILIQRTDIFSAV